jgi:RNA-binding protein
MRGGMKKLGTVKTIIHDGSILLQATEVPSPGTRVCDMRGDEVGRIIRVFGPVTGPYVSVRPKPGTETVGLLGATLYSGSEEQPRHSRSVKAYAPKERRARFGPRSGGPGKKKGVNTWQRKGKPRKK